MQRKHRFNLGSPIWQGVGVIVSIIGLCISVFIAYDIYNRSSGIADFRVEKFGAYNPIAFADYDTSNITMSINGITVKSVKIFSYKISNSGKLPILPDDFIQPLEVQIETPYQILTIEQDAPDSSGIKALWTSVTSNTFVMEPTLFNPSDSIYLLVFVTNLQDNSDNLEEIPEPTWSARIVNIPKVNLQEYQTREERESLALGPFYTLVYHYGYGVFLFAFCTITLFITGYMIGKHYGNIHNRAIPELFLVTCLMAFSVASGEILVDYFFYNRRQSWMASVIILAHIVLLGYLLWPATVKLYNDIRGARKGTNKNTPTNIKP